MPRWLATAARFVLPGLAVEGRSVNLSYVGVGVGLGVLVLSGTADFERAADLRAPSSSGIMQQAVVVEKTVLAENKTKTDTPPPPRTEQPKDERDKSKAPKKPSHPHRGKFDTDDTPDTDDDETAFAATGLIAPAPARPDAP